jgi:hypothetical protein
MTRIGKRAKLFGVIILAVLCGAGATASGDGGYDTPRWALATRDYSSAGSSAVLTPGNDTRVNLLLLLADRVPDGRVRSPEPGKAAASFGWSELVAHAGPPPAPVDGDHASQSEDDQWYEPSRCQSNEGGSVAFTAAVRASPNIPAAEKSQLVAAREALDPWHRPVEQYVTVTCGRPDMSKQPLTGIASAGGREFARYLDGAASFYGGEFDDALIHFSTLASATDPWVREAALYMVARARLNAAQQYDEYGDLVEAAKRDQAAIAAAGAAFNTYLRAYPKGRYASSARGLLRRVAWLAGDAPELSRAYGRLLAAQPDLPTAADLTQEIDLKLFSDFGGKQVSGAILLAVADLLRMRKVDPEYGCTGPMSWCFKPITKAEIEVQKAQFGNDTELYDYIRAAEAFFVRNEPREVLQIIPDASHQGRFTYLQFSRQMLRGFALEALSDRNARGFLLDLFGGANRPFQRDALELQLAMHDERSGNLPLVFGPDSRVRSPFIREILLDHIAGPDLLRQQATAAPSRQQREAALYILLAKELRHGLYSNFVTDVRLVPAGSRSDGYFFGVDDMGNYPIEPDAKSASDDQVQRSIPLGVFTRRTGLGGLGCPSLIDTVSVLARDRNSIRARLCLGEFMRDSSLDPFTFDEPLEGGGLASTKPLFPGPAFQRLDVYRSVIADGTASAEEKAFALNRAIRCYAPSRYNHCGGTDVELPQRRAWFNRLKSTYPQSEWAKSLKYYW